MTILSKIDNNGGFAAGTLVHTDKGLVPIQDIKIGDMVLSKPEDGDGEAEFKPVINTFIYKEKELWLLQVEKHIDFKKIYTHDDFITLSKIHESATRNIDLLLTANHPVYVIGQTIITSNDKGEENISSINYYQYPQWKKVEDLEKHEILINRKGVIYHVQRAQPVYQFDTYLERLETKPSYMWYQDDYYGKEYDNYGNVIKYDTNGNCRTR